MNETLVQRINAVLEENPKLSDRVYLRAILIKQAQWEKDVFHAETILTELGFAEDIENEVSENKDLTHRDE